MMDLGPIPALDNPAWYSLTTHHAHLALGGALAKRYPPDMAAIAALATPELSAFSELQSLVAENEAVYLAGVEPPLPPPWTVNFQTTAVQMICQRPIETKLTGVDVLQLAEGDVAEMLALTELMQVGPFHSRTYQMGTYLGIRVQGRLVAMAGEFLFPDTYREIHVVCTHPDYRGRGFATLLVSRLVNANLERGFTPFLFVMPHREQARTLYERLGFVERRRIPMVSIKR